MRRLLSLLLGIGLLACASYGAWATFPGSPGSTQYRNPAYLRPYTAQSLVAVGNTVLVDWREGPWFQITLTANTTFSPPINVGEQCILITIVQDGVGSRTATWTNTSGGSGWKWSGATAGTLTTTAGAVDQVVACPWKSGITNAASLVLNTNFK